MKKFAVLTALFLLFLSPALNTNAQKSDDTTGLDNQASKLYEQGKYHEAIPLAERDLSMKEKSLGPDHPDLGASLNNLAGLYLSIGSYAQAEPLFKRALAIREKVLGPDHPDVAASLNNLALLYDNIGSYTQAELLYKRALAIDEKALGPDYPDLGASLNNLAALYDDLGLYAQAEPLFKRALAIAEKALGPDHPNVATCLSNLALLYVHVGSYVQAEPLYNRALAIDEKAFGPDHPNVATCLSNLAGLYIENGRSEDGYKIFKEKDKPLGLGKYYLAQRDYTTAEKEFLRALRRIENSNKIESLLACYTGLGLSAEGAEDYRKAKKYFSKAITLIGNQWQTLDFAARQQFMSGKTGAGFLRLEPYAGMIRALLKEKGKNYQKEALSFAERAKSRILLDMLASRGLSGRVKEDSEIIAKDRSYQQDLMVLTKRMEIMQRLGDKAFQGVLKNLQVEFMEKEAAYELFLQEIKLKNSEVASLISVSPTPIEKLQVLLDPDTTLLEYYSTKNKLYAWLVTRDKVRVYEVPVTEKQLQDKVNEVLLSNISNAPRKAEPVIICIPGEEGKKETNEMERKKNREQFYKAATGLYQSILSPVASAIMTQKLLIVPHGVLHKVPFTALTDGKEFMVDKYSISVLPSASIIEHLVKKRKQGKDSLLTLANPKTNYVQLGFAEKEGEAISPLFAQKEIYRKEQATETVAKDSASRFSVIHFATHGEFNDRQPLQSGLLLAQDEKNDGKLQVHEVFGLNLKNATLVTLSACETGLSKVQGGDDLVGLSNGFIYAGTPSILGTLWSVDDQSTSILIKDFYENWLVKGMSKPEALRQAQITLKAIPQYNHPFYWAPFEMIGDWR